ncbi:LysR family transcriptional regulator [Vibrio sp. JC009]|uniref:LysR family transcriptional regulator n=1 Tax=Vibrio sp. JC009 TaxID=2912314 RepID=UPI0023B1FE8F|nr:LysR family transcriptional regulator [Vibrio sp. JC009]WED23469.1 LysR family transcriptional regulator [Vibrio sp. JC009]
MLTRSDELEILVAVVDHGSFSAAAEALNIQVAKVSRVISKIEQKLGVTLLNRTTRRLQLTEEGHYFVNAARKFLLEIEQTEESLLSLGDAPKGKLRIDAASPFIIHQLVPLVEKFKQEYPQITLDLSSHEGFIDLLENKTDIAIRIGKLSDSTLYVRNLGHSPLHIVASPAYLAKHGVPKKLEDLKEHKLIGFTGPKVLNQWGLKGGEYIEASISASNGEAVRHLALSGIGIACLSNFMVHEDIAQGTLVPLLATEKVTMPEREQVNAVYYKSSAVACRVSVFIEFLKKHLTL